MTKCKDCDGRSCDECGGPTTAVLSAFSCNGCKHLADGMRYVQVEYDGEMGDAPGYNCTHPKAAENIQRRSDWLTPVGCPFNPFERPLWELKLDYPTGDWI